MSAAPQASAAVAAADVRAALTLFASALAGCDVVLREVPESTQVLPAWPLRPGGSAVRQVELPSRVCVFGTRGDNRALCRLVVMRQVVGIGTATPDPLDATRSALWRRVFRILELHRIDAAIARDYPGARADLARLRAHTLVQRPRRTAAHPVRAALEVLLHWALGVPDPHGTWHALRAHAATLERDDASEQDSAWVATRICMALSHRWHVRRGSMHAVDGHPPQGPEIASPVVEPDGDAPSIAAPGVSMPAAARAPASNADGGAVWTDDATGNGAWTVPAPGAHQRLQLPPRQRVAATPAPARTGARDTPQGRPHAIDEWDWHQQRFLPGWCTLYERRLRGRDSQFMRGVRRRHAALAREVHRRFAALRPQALQRVHGASDGDELEIDRVIEAVVEHRAGRLSDRALYLRRDRALRDVSAVFLVDTSASTDYVLRDPHATAAPAPVPAAHDEVYLYDAALVQAASAHAAPPRRVIDVAKDALALMCDALQTLGDRFAVYAFSGSGRAQVEFSVVKAFDDAVSAHTSAALSALRPQGATRAGAAIRHASAQLARQPQRHKVLIVVSDGYPEDIDYGPEPRELRYAIEDTAHALREAQALGIETFNLSIDPAGHDYLRRMCPRERYMVIGDVSALPGELTKVYQALTRRAS